MASSKTGSRAPKLRGRPILGALAGLVLGLCLAFELLVLGKVSVGSPLIVGLPVLGLVAGIAGAFWAPLGRRRPPQRRA